MIPFDPFSDDVFMGRLLEWLPHAKLHTMAVVSKQTVIFTDREKIRRINSNPNYLFHGFSKIESVVKLLFRNPDQVKFLNLTSFKITQLDFASIITSSRSLVRLKLYKHPVGNEVCALIARDLKKLVKLDISWCVGLTDRGVSELSNGLPELQILNLSGSHQITDASLTAIHTGLRSLRKLNIYKCIDITAAAVRKLCEELPNLQWLFIEMGSTTIFVKDFLKLREDFPHIDI